jgi:cytochrome c peroxidase
VGHAEALPRRTPTILNVAWAEALFWDGRAGSLEEQALGPIASPDEMNLPLEALVPKLRAIPEYAAEFEAAYPGEGIGTATIAKAIASFERTVVSGRAPFDAWIEGDEDAIDEAAARLRALQREGALLDLPRGWRFTDDSFHDIGRGATTAGAWRRARGHRGAPIRAPRRRPAASTAARPTCTTARRRTLEDTIALYDLGGRVRRLTSRGDRAPRADRRGVAAARRVPAHPDERRRPSRSRACRDGGSPRWPPSVSSSPPGRGRRTIVSQKGAVRPSSCKVRRATAWSSTTTTTSPTTSSRGPRAAFNVKLRSPARKPSGLEPRRGRRALCHPPADEAAHPGGE